MQVLFTPGFPSLGPKGETSSHAHPCHHHTTRSARARRAPMKGRFTAATHLLAAS